jgi:hypothetical protein
MITAAQVVFIILTLWFFLGWPLFNIIRNRERGDNIKYLMLGIWFVLFVTLAYHVNQH